MNTQQMKRRELIFFYLLVLFLSILSGQVHAQQTAQIFTRQIGFLISLPEDYRNDTAKKWPLLFFLHGIGECGTDIQKVKVNGPPKLVAAGKHFPFIIVSPQAQDPDIGWEPEDLNRLLVYVKQTYRVDDTRVYLTGLSMGGFGTWALAIKHPEEFAAMIPICGGGDSAEAWRLRHIPIWCFHGALDNVVPVARDEQMITAVKRYNPLAKFTVYPDAFHNSWERTYNNDSVYDWLLKQTKFTYKEVKVGRQVLNDYAGTFVGNQGDTIVLSVDEKGLQAKTPNGSFALKPSADNLFFIDEHLPVDITFIQNTQGRCNSFIVFEQTKNIYKR
jgi:pimeloyl-ACP methyl ester carboxylesterase